MTTWHAWTAWLQSKWLPNWGATIGRQFSYALFRAVSPLDETTLQQGLHQL